MPIKLLKKERDIMIQTKEDLKYYLEEDRKAYHKEKLTGLKAYIRDIAFHDYNYEYIKNLRKWEYQLNTGGGATIFLCLAMWKDKIKMWHWFAA